MGSGFYPITMEELSEIVDLSEEMIIVESMPQKTEIARRRIEIFNRVRSRGII